jgi:Xaa-Pro aminopeptidase
MSLTVAAVQAALRADGLARVDAGTIELIRGLDVDVVSSCDLVQRFASVWNEAALDSHRRASDTLYRVKDRAFDDIARRVAADESTTEYDIQPLMDVWFREEGLVSDSSPNVSAEGNPGNPHYVLHRTGFTIEPGVYFDDFGVRTEIHMVVQARDAAVTGALQAEILALG